MKLFSNQKLKSYPITNNNLIKRNRLEQQIQVNLDKKLILVISHAGSGKTSLISSVIESSRVDHIWYSLDTSDQDISSFVYHFASLVQTSYPQSFKGFEKKLTSNESYSEPPALLAFRFVNEFKKRLTPWKRFIIVLDNYETVNNSLIMNHFLDQTLKSFPPSITFILCSTQTPNIRLSKLALNNELYQINGADLAFNLEEMEELFSSIYHIDISREDLERVYEKTEGWVTGLILFIQFLKMKGPQTIEDLLSSVNRYGKTISKYLMENVFESQPKHIQKFLCKTALLSYLSPDICNQALDVKYSGRLLENLVDNNLFTFYVDSKNFLYRYHLLMKEFLLNKLYEDFSQDEIEEFQAKLGEILTPIDPENAIQHFISAKCFPKVVDIMRSLGEKMLHEYRFKSLHNLLKSIPQSFIEDDPSLLYFSGRISETMGETDQAFECYEKVFHLFKKQKEIPNKVASLNRMAVIHIRQDKYQCAKDLLQDNIHCLESQGMKKDVAHRLITGYTNISQVLFKLEEWQKAESYFEKGETIYDFYPNPYDQLVLTQCQALKYLVEGNLVKGIEVAKKGEVLALELHLPTKIHIFYHYLAFAHLFLGCFSQSRDYSHKGLDFTQQFGIEDNITGALFADLGQVHYAFSNYEQAIKALNHSLAIFRRSQNVCGNFWSNHALYHISLKLGDTEEAKKYLQVLFHLANGMGLPLEIGMAMTNQAYFSSLRGEEKGVLEWIEKGQHYFKQSKKKMSIFFAHLIAAKACINIGNEGLTEGFILESLKLLEGENFYLYGVHHERNWLLSFLQRFTSRMPQCRKLLAAYQNVVLSSFESDKESRNPQNFAAENGKGNRELLNLRIYSLGPFRIFVDNEEIPLSQCKSKKAITLLKYLFFARHKGPVSKDILLELLWQDSSTKQADLNFRVTLSILRKTLSFPRNGRRDFQNLLKREGGYQLSPGKEGWSDVDEFANEMNLARYKEKKQNYHEALCHYQSAENLYQGDFMMENLYDDWCFIEREHLRNQYLHALNKILDYHKEQHNLSEAINYCYKILKVDPYREDISRKLMQYHSELGNRREVRSVFEFCRKNVEDNLGLVVSYETKELYRKLSLSP